MNGQQSEAMIMIIVMPTMFVIIGWAFKTILNFFQTRSHMKHHYALQDKLLDKLGTSPEALEYLRSGASEDVFAFAIQERGNPYGRILSALQAGSVLSLLAIGFLILRGMLAETFEGFTVAGVLGLCLGIGFLLSSGAAYFFSKKWGLVNGSRDDEA
jgi:hypothetical protein